MITWVKSMKKVLLSQILKKISLQAFKSKYLMLRIGAAHRNICRKRIEKFREVQRTETIYIDYVMVRCTL